MEYGTDQKLTPLASWQKGCARGVYKLIASPTLYLFTLLPLRLSKKLWAERNVLPASVRAHTVPKPYQNRLDVFRFLAMQDNADLCERRRLLKEGLHWHMKHFSLQGSYKVFLLLSFLSSSYLIADKA
jgi:hypothetical protein